MNYWWFIHCHHDSLWAHPDPSKSVPLHDLRYNTDGLRAILWEQAHWRPMSAADSARCEQSLQQGSNHATVLPHQLAVVDVQLMHLQPIYWPGSKCPVRRSCWFVIGVGALPLPVPPVLSVMLEQRLAQVSSWLSVPGDGCTVEKVLSLERPFHEHMIIFRQGLLHQAYLCPVTRSKSPIGEDAGGSRHDGFVKIVRGFDNLARLCPEYSLPAPPTHDDPPNAPSPPHAPSHLVIAVHGIGQKLAHKLGHSFIRDVNCLRDQFDVATKAKAASPASVSVLPVFWRPELRLPANYYHDRCESPASSFDLVLSRMVPQSVPIVRSLFSDVALDILLYMTPQHRTLIIESLLGELRRVYLLFTKWNPHFVGKIHLFGHSLGSTILADILSNNLCPFPVSGFFSVGSPASLFFLLKHQRPVGCSLLLADVESAGAAGDRPEAVLLHCHSFYNIYHPHDPLAYRMEPLVDERLACLHPPVVIPYQKAGLTGLKLGIDDGLSKASESIQRTLKQLTAITGRLSRTLSKEQTQPTQQPKSVTASGHAYKSFNKRGRIDFVLQDSLIESAYLSSLTSHFGYWQDIDVAMFIVGEILS